MNRATLYRSFALVALTLASCTDEPAPTTPPDGNDIAVPTAYSFDSRFTPGTSSVSYEGQVVRNLLIQDLTAAVTGMSRTGAVAVSEADLLKLYEHSDASNLTSTTSVTGRTFLESRYSAISTGKKLTDKISSAPVMGMSGNADQLVRAWIHTVAMNAQDPTKLGTPAVLLDDNGLDLGEMINKVLLGAVSYYQATSVYMSGMLGKSNAAAATGAGGVAQPFSEMEHSWDEAFGYFGAARDFARYTDDQLATGTDYVHDSNGDGKIDFRSEFNFTFARYAARRDRSVPGTDFTKEIFDAFLSGRTAIVNEKSEAEIIAQRTAASQAWEKVIASSVVHYLNDVRDGMAKIGTAEENLTSLSHVWSEMKGYLIALQYNSMKMISDAQLQQLHTIMGAKPVLAAPATAEHTAYLAGLDNAAATLKGVYGFTDAQMSAW